MIKKINFLFDILNKKQKTRLSILLFLMVFSSLIEITTIVFLIEFVSILGSEGFSSGVSIIERFANILNLNTDFLNLETFSYILIFTIALNSIFVLATIYFTSKLSLTTGGEMESSLFRYYLRKNYLFHINSSSSQLMNNIFELVRRVSNFVLEPSLVIISKIIFLLPLLTGLIIYQPLVAVISIFLILTSYMIFFRLFRHKMGNLGKTESVITEKKYSILQEGLNGIKEVKILNKFDFFKNIYDQLFAKLVQIEVNRDIIGKFPRYLIELFFFVFTVLIILFLSRSLNLTFNEIIISLSIFIICSYKIIPAFQQIYYHLTIIKNHIPALDQISEDLKKSIQNEDLKDLKLRNNTNFSNFNKIIINNLSFDYNNKNLSIVKNLSFEIKRGDKIALTGLSGSGKTTLINIILGLLTPSSGEILIDNEKINISNLNNWQKILGFVPQSIFFNERSIKENIAFGIPKKDIDINKVKELIKKTKLSKVVESLPHKENTEVGERGIKLSGGQQQRLGIARALYNDPKILILDEATNSLDNLTENEILAFLENFGKEITVIMIAHKNDVIKRFNKIIFLHRGIISGFDNYENLIKSNEDFKNLIDVKKTTEKDNLF